MTHVALSVITDEFVKFVQTLQKSNQQLEELSSFILIAATLLDIKASRLLPTEEEFDEEDLELLEARDLLFAKLLQYKAYKDVALTLLERLNYGAKRYPRTALLEEKFAKLLPELKWNTDAKQIAILAAASLTAYSYRTQDVSLNHIHMRQVNVAEQGVIVSKLLQKKGSLKFSELIADTKEAVVIIGRFLSLLELYKMNAVVFEQKTALNDLVVKWVALENFNPEQRLVGSDFDTPVNTIKKTIKNHRDKKGEK